MAEESVDWWKELSMEFSMDWDYLNGVSSDTSNVPTAFHNHPFPIVVEAPRTLLPSQTSEHIQFHSNKGRRITWTKVEHRGFLEGLDIYGKGNWKKISAYVQTKSASQVASHAQKYFIRQSKSKEQKKRKSIHDMVIENTTHTNIHIQNSSSHRNLAGSQFFEMQPQQQVIPFNPHINMPHPQELNHINTTYQQLEEMINQNHMNSNNIIDHHANFNQMIPFNPNYINMLHPPELNHIDTLNQHSQNYGIHSIHPTELNQMQPTF